AWAGQPLVDDGDGRVRDLDMVVALFARVLETHMLQHEQAGRLIVKLLADVLAELDARLVAAGADAFGFAQSVLDASAWQILGQRPAAMPFAFGLGGIVVVAR